ncbi:MAG: hypothetical protein KDB35_05245 [Acidimicrobiales bacterium]|nr:hypothetical protein [Acidimicrobiales bacterium]
MTTHGSAGERWVVVGLASPRSPWFQELGRWSAAAAVPVDFLRCVSPEEVRARFAAGRAISAMVVDGAHHGVDRDLIDVAAHAGAAVLVVDDGRVPRDWRTLGATAVLDAPVEREALLDALASHARPVQRGDQLLDLAHPHGSSDSVAASEPGRLVAVTGGGGAGTSTVAMALAQGLATDPRHRGLVLLADLALRADQALLHDAGDVVPGLQELVDAHRNGVPTPTEVRRSTFAVDGRGYDLLLGLRRHRDWVTLRPRALQATLGSLRLAYRFVIADVTADLEGEAEIGSTDVEDRNVCARTAIAGAELVVVVGAPSIVGIHRLVQVLHEVHDHGVAPQRILPVLNGAPRRGRARAELHTSLAQLCGQLGSELPTALTLPRRRIDDAMRVVAALPTALTLPLARAVSAMTDHERAAEPTEPTPEPVLVAPGSLGHWHGDDGEESA